MNNIPPSPNFDISSEISAIIQAFASGALYGVKIRLPHAAVMTFIFRTGSVKDKLKYIFKVTSEHSRNLASFALVYKTILFLLKRTSVRLRSHDIDYRNHTYNALGNSIGSILVDGPGYGRRLIPRPPGIPERSQHAAIAGAVGGYIIWGKYSSVNYQIVMYLTSRILIAMVHLAREKNIPPFCWKSMTFKNVYKYKAALVWSISMFLFETYPHVLHPSLKQSMDDIYRNKILKQLKR